MTLVSRTKMLDEAKNGRKGHGWFIEILIFIALFFVTDEIMSIPTVVATVFAAMNSPEFQAASQAAYSGESVDYMELISRLMGTLPWWYTLLSLFVAGLQIVTGIFFCTKIQKRTVASMGFRKGNALKEYLMGALIGTVAIAATVGIAAITGALYLITTCFSFIATMNLESTLPMIDKLAGAMIKLGEAMALLAVFGVAGAVGSGAVVPAVATMVATLTALGAISQIPGFDWLMGEGMAVLTKIGTAIGEFAGSIISGFTTEASSGLPTLGNNLSAFMDGATPFIEGCKKVDDKVVNGVKLLIGAIGSFMAEGFIDNVLKRCTNLVGKSIYTSCNLTTFILRCHHLICYVYSKVAFSNLIDDCNTSSKSFSHLCGKENVKCDKEDK